MTDPIQARPSHENGAPIHVHPGTRLLHGIEDGPTLDAHRANTGPVPDLSLSQLLELLGAVSIRGRGGAGFPFATKLEAASAASGRKTVVVNVSEGEPASFKDAALALTCPHLILDGAVLTARALDAKTIHLVLPTEHPEVQRSLRAALAERAGTDGKFQWTLHNADARFVAGQARAVIELMSGRENLPVTAWQPEALKGYKGRPTLLSNAETFSQVAVLAAMGAGRYRDHGTAEEPGTCLLTIAGDGPCPQVVEVAHGKPWFDVLPAATLDRPVLVGGYHGTWAAAPTLRRLTVSRSGMTEHGLALGAGVVLPLEPGDCPLHRTARVTSYLAGQSARRCGPCLNGLPALATTMWHIHRGVREADRVDELSRQLSRRGACAHPDGTLRMVASMMSSFGDEIERHAQGHCSYVEASSTLRLDADALAGAVR